VSSQLTVVADRDQPATATVGMFTSLAVTKAVTLSAQATFGTVSAPLPQVNALLSLSWALPGGIYAGAGGTISNNQPGVNLQVSRSPGIGTGWGMSGAATITEREADVTLTHRVQTNTATIQTLFDWTGNGGTLSVNPAGSLAWVTGHGFFVSRPLTDAFALVRVPGLKGVRVYTSSQEVGRTDEKGDLIVPNLVSYYPTPLGISADDVPLAYTLDEEKLTLAPPRRGAAYAEFVVARVHYFRGQAVVVREGKEEAPSYGDLAVKDSRGREFISPLGKDGEFELEGLPAGAHPAEVRYRHGICKFTLEAKDIEALVIDVGTVRCTLGRPAATAVDRVPAAR
jgi:outer membrane usher protein